MEPLVDLPGHLLRRCHQISVALFHEECAAFDITPLQFAVLKTLMENGPLDQVTIGGLAALDRTTVAVVLQKLELRKMLRRVQSQTDRRQNIVSLTERGKRLIGDVSEAVSRAQAKTVAPFVGAEKAEFIRLLSKLAETNNAHSRAPLKRLKTRG